MTDLEIADHLKRLNEATMLVAKITTQLMGEDCGPYAAHERAKHGEPSDLARLKACFDAIGVKYAEEENGPPRFAPALVVSLKDERGGSDAVCDFIFDLEGNFLNQAIWENSR